MSADNSPLIIDAYPRGPDGPLALTVVHGRTVLEWHLDVSAALGKVNTVVHAPAEDHHQLNRVLQPVADHVRLAPGLPPESGFILRTDCLYEPARLRRLYRRGRDPDRAVLWRLNSPAGLASAEDELLRRRHFQPLGRFWALAPARMLARQLRPTRVRPNALTLLAAVLVLAASAAVASGGQGPTVRFGVAALLAAALVLDTADGHLARLQGTASRFGHWLDATLDELGDMALHAAVAWAMWAQTAHPGWLLAGTAYGMSKYLFMMSSRAWDESGPPRDPPRTEVQASSARALADILGHADVRWHLWIVLAAAGRLEAELIAFTLYYPLRTLTGAVRKARGHA